MKKSLTKMLMALLLVAALLPVKALAAADLSFQIVTSGANVSVVSAGAAERKISSLQFSLTVNAGSASVVEFEFSEAVQAVSKVQEFRYDASTRTMNLYISGTEPLFAPGTTTLSIGKVTASNTSGSAVSATVRAVPSSVKYVEGSELQVPTPTPVPTTPPVTPPDIPWTPDPMPTPETTPTPTLTPTPTPEATPTPTEAPTPTPVTGPQLLSSLRLYINGDVTESYSEKGYAKVWNKAGYSVAFKSNNTKVATVGKSKGLVTAVSVGSAKVTATFTDLKTGEKIVKTCKITVKRNADDAGISKDNATRLKNLTVGEKFTLKAFRTDSDGKTVWSGKTKITDSPRFRSSNTAVFKVNKTSGEITAVGPGKATLTVWAVQSEKPLCDKKGKVIEYQATTEPRKYTVIVKDDEE